MKMWQQKYEAANKTISDLCHGQMEWIMSIPVREDYDPDVVIGSALQAMREEIERLENVLAEIACNRNRPGGPGGDLEWYAEFAVSTATMAIERHDGS